MAAAKPWGPTRVFANALAAAARGARAGRGAGEGAAGPPHAPQLALAGLQHAALPMMQRGEATSLGQALSDIMGALWLAVPKKRVSRARRAMRNAPKYLRWDHSIMECAKCGAPRRPHTYCDKFNCGKPDADAASGTAAAAPASDPELASK